MTIVLPLVKAARRSSVWVLVSRWASAAAGLVFGGGGEDHCVRCVSAVLNMCARRGVLAAVCAQRSGRNLNLPAFLSRSGGLRSAYCDKVTATRRSVSRLSDLRVVPAGRSIRLSVCRHTSMLLVLPL